MTVLIPVARETVWGTNIVVEVSSAAPTADPVWVDISAWVIVPGGVTLGTTIGRATELDSSEPGRFQLVLNNRDSRFTPGNTSSPYYPWFKQARRLRIREVVAWRAFDLLDGYIEIPDNLIYTEVVGEADSDITLAVSGLDRVGREANGRPFISTLAAHILGSSTKATLLHYWPLGDPTTTQRPALGDTILRRQPDPLVLPGMLLTDAITPNGGTAMPGDDLTPPQWVWSEEQDPPDDRTDPLYAAFPTPMAVSAGQIVTVCCWLRTGDPPASFVGSGTVWSLSELSGGFQSFDLQWGPISLDTGFEFAASASGSGGGGWVAAEFNNYYTGSAPTMITVQLDVTTGDLTWWLNQNEILAPSSDPPPASWGFDVVYAGLFYIGEICHLQIYQGDAGTFTRADHLAQLEVGMYGYERQTTGARINTIADLIGIPAAARDIDEGVALMSKASLAGLTAADAWREAVDTERGRLTTDAGRLVFHDRRRVYDV